MSDLRQAAERLAEPPTESTKHMGRSLAEATGRRARSKPI